MDKGKVKASREKALKKVMALLSAENIEAQFDNLSGDYHSKDKFLVSWNGDYRGMAAEYALCKVDAFYTAYSHGIVCIYQSAGLLHERQLGAYYSFERGLLEIGLKLCPNKKEKDAFIAKYVVPYNDRLKAKRDAQEVHSR